MVRRIVGLIAQLSEACPSCVTLRGTAKIAARALAGGGLALWLHNRRRKVALGAFLPSRVRQNIWRKTISPSLPLPSHQLGRRAECNGLITAKLSRGITLELARRK